MVDTIDSYAETEYDSDTSLAIVHPSDSAAYSCTGQSFTMIGTNRYLSSVKFYLSKTGSPTGVLRAILYAHTGTYGTSSVPTGTALATSDDFDTSTLTTSPTLITFTFPESQRYLMIANAYYCIMIQVTSGTVNNGNNINVGRDHDSPSHSGNGSSYTNGAWVTTTYDRIFYVYGSTSIGQAFSKACAETINLGLYLLAGLPWKQFPLEFFDRLGLSQVLSISSSHVKRFNKGIPESFKMNLKYFAECVWLEFPIIFPGLFLNESITLSVAYSKVHWAWFFAVCDEGLELVERFRRYKSVMKKWFERPRQKVECT